MPCYEMNGDVEGFGIVYLEAALAGKPSIAGNSGGAGEAVINGNTGLLVNPNQDLSSLEKALVQLLTNKELREQLGEAGKSRVEQEFLWEKTMINFKNKLKNA